MKKLIITLTIFIVISTAAIAQQEVQMSDAQKELYNLGFDIPRGTLASLDFTTTDINGNEVSLNSFRGKLVFLNLWATWCPPCQKEMPSMQRLSEKMKGKDFTILAVGTPTPRGNKGKDTGIHQAKQLYFPCTCG